MSIVFIALYFILLIYLGLKYSTQQNSREEYIAASHGLGYWIAAFSARATGESGWLILGLTGVGFAIGLSGLWIALGETLGVAISWFIIIPKFKQESMEIKPEPLTVIDYFAFKLNDNKHILRIIFTFVLLIMVTAYIAAQLTATGKAFNSFYNINIIIAEVIGAVIVLLYVVFGGFRAVAISDLIQGILMLVGLIIVPIVAIFYIGDFSLIISKFNNLPSNFINIFPHDETNYRVILTIIGFMGPGLGFLGSPQIYQRIIAMKKENWKSEIAKGRIVAILYTIITDSFAVFTGMIGRYFFDTLSDVETIYPALVKILFPSIFVGIFIAIILSAIMSTMDSLLILASTTFVNDFYKNVINSKISEKGSVILLRTVTIIIAGIGLFFAAIKIRLIFWMVLFAWAGIASAFCPTLIMTLFWNKTNKYGVMAGAIGGFITAIVWKIYFSHIIYEMIPAFIISFLFIIVFSFLFKNKE